MERARAKRAKSLGMGDITTIGGGKGRKCKANVLENDYTNEGELYTPGEEREEGGDEEQMGDLRATVTGGCVVLYRDRKSVV